MPYLCFSCSVSRPGRYMAGFTLFFFASGAALYMSSYFIKNPVKFGVSRFVYLGLMIVVGVLTCLVPGRERVYISPCARALVVRVVCTNHVARDQTAEVSMGSGTRGNDPQWS